jgi:integrase
MDAFLVALRATSPSRQRKAKVVLGAMLDLALRHDALAVNPVRHTSRLRRPSTVTRSLTLDEIKRLRRALRESMSQKRPGPNDSADLNDVFELMLGTGARIGELLALRWCEVDLESPRPTLTITGTIKTERGRGTYRKPSPKTDAGVRTVALPPFAVAVLRRRRAEDPDNDLDALFATRNGTWQQVANIERRWRKIRQLADLEWVTPHIFRKTVATLISERVDADTASQQLGHSSPSITREFYIAKPAIATDVAHVLQELADESWSPRGLLP